MSDTRKPTAFECWCCGIPGIYYDNEACDSCEDGDCDPEMTWHCFTGYCDGTGCTYAGECEPVAPDHCSTPAMHGKPMHFC